MKSTIKIGDTVSHRVPSMLYGQKALVVAEAGRRYGNRYVTVLYTHPTTNNTLKTDFWEKVLY